MFAQHNTKPNHILSLNYIKISHLSRVVWQFGAFLLGNLTHYKRSSVILIAFSETSHCFANAEILI